MDQVISPIALQVPRARHLDAFLAAVRQSRSLHRGRVAPPASAEAFRAYLARLRRPTHAGYLIVDGEQNLLGVVNLNEIVRGVFQSAYLGYYAFAPHQRRGNMTEGLRQVVTQAFRTHRLHRVEANVMPHNEASLRLVRRVGFRREGYSPRYLKIAGRWQDHERWALTREDWRDRR